MLHPNATRMKAGFYLIPVQMETCFHQSCFQMKEHFNRMRTWQKMTALVSLLWCLCYGLTLATAQPANAPLNLADGPVIPFEYDPLLTPVPIVQMSLNGSPPLKFILDTAWGPPLAIEKWVAEKYNLPVLRSIKDRTGKRKIADLVGVKDVLLLQKEGEEAVTMGLEEAVMKDYGFSDAGYTKERIAGVLGLPILANLTLRFDFVAKTLMAYPQPHAPLNLPNAVRLPLTQPWLDKKNRFFATPVAFLKDESIPMMIDTGATNSSIPEELASLFENVAQGKARVKTVSWDENVERQNVEHNKFLLPKVGLGTLEEPVVDFGVDKDAFRPALLGMDILSRFRVTLDFRNQQMFLERASNYQSRVRVDGETGINLKRVGLREIAESVTPNSAAAKAGVRQGDVIVAVDGRRLSDLPAEAAWRWLKGFAATDVEVVLEREKGDKTEKLTVHFVRDSSFQPVPGPEVGVGLNLLALPSGKIKVGRVDAGSPAQEAGIHPGEEVVEMDGKSAKLLTSFQIKSILKKSVGDELTLKLRRQGEEMPREIKLKFRKLQQR
jgi:hypothetical protein